MKKLIILLIASFTYTSLLAQCDKIFDFKEGTSWTWSNYNKKGKLLGKTIQKIDNLTINDDDRLAEISMVMVDDKGEQNSPVVMEMGCRDGVVYFDMKKFLPDEYLKEEEMELAIEASNLEMPSNMEVGDRLNDGSVKMNISGATSGASAMGLSLSVLITDRKVVARETLNTAAGEFDCLILEQTMTTKMMVTMEMVTKEWYAVGVGMVKSETYRKGKLTGYSMLTAFSR